MLAVWPLVIVAGTVVAVSWARREPSAPESIAPQVGVLDEAVAPRPPDAGEDAARLRTALDTTITWLYRREQWDGLSHDGRYIEPAPGPTWGEKKYEQLAIEAWKYAPPKQIIPEPGFKPPDDPPRQTPSTAERVLLPAAWLSDPADLSTIALTRQVFEEALEQATRFASSELGDDAEVWFDWVDLAPQAEINFKASSKTATRALSIAVGASGPRAWYRLKRYVTPESDTELWRVDDSWSRLISKSWQRERSDHIGSVALHPRSIYESGAPNESGWRVTYRYPDELPIPDRDYTLRDGDLLDITDRY